MYFLDIPIDKTGTDYKRTHTGQYCDFNCSLLWIYKNLRIYSFYTVKGKYLRPQRNLNLKLIRLNCFCHETAIHCTLVILSLAYLEATLNQKEMVTKTTKKAIWVCI